MLTLQLRSVLQDAGCRATSRGDRSVSRSPRCKRARATAGGARRTRRGARCRPGRGHRCNRRGSSRLPQSPQPPAAGACGDRAGTSPATRDPSTLRNAGRRTTPSRSGRECRVGRGGVRSGRGACRVADAAIRSCKVVAERSTNLGSKPRWAANAISGTPRHR